MTSTPNPDCWMQGATAWHVLIWVLTNWNTRPIPFQSPTGRSHTPRKTSAVSALGSAAQIGAMLYPFGHPPPYGT